MANFTYIIVDEETRKAAIIDPSWDLEKIFYNLKKNSWKLEYIINTHSHGDHVSGNVALPATVEIIAHENTRLWLATDVTWPWDGRRFTRAPRIAQPNKTFYDKGQLDSGIRYGYIPDCAHTDGDLYVYFPEQNVLAVGDILSGQGWPVVDWWTGGWIGGIVGGLQRLQTVANAERFITQELKEMEEQLAAERVAWMEEPLHRGDYDGMTELRRRVDVPIAGGELTRLRYHPGQQKTASGERNRAESVARPQTRRT